MVMLSILKVDYNASQNNSLHFGFNRSISSNSMKVWYISYSIYQIKAIGCSYLLISSKYSSSPYFNVVNAVTFDPHQNLTTSNATTCTCNISSTFNASGSSIIGLATLYEICNSLNYNYLLGFALKFTGITGTQATFSVPGTFTQPAYL